MAFNPIVIPATDFYPNIGVGVNLPFNAPSCFSPNYTSTEAIKNNLINFFLTEPGERLDNPNFGGGLRSFIFEQIAQDTLEGIESDISAKIENVFPSIVLDRVIVSTIPDTNTIKVTIKYSFNNQNTSDQIEFNFS